MSPAKLISVIIPTFNEESCLETLLSMLHPSPRLEIIVVDGGSLDSTLNIAQKHNVRIMTTAKGRAGQLNTGAEAAIGEIVFFLHADSILPDGFDSHIRDMISTQSYFAGAFAFAVGQEGKRFRFLEHLVNFRSTYLQMPYGDQGLFMRRENFNKLKGFRNLAVMEDFDLVRRSKRLGRIGIVPAPITTSARRWLQHGMLRTTLINQLLIAGFYLGVAPDRLAAWQRRHYRR